MSDKEEKRKFMRIREDAIISYNLIPRDRIKERRKFSRITEDDSIGYVLVPNFKSARSLTQDLSIGGIRFFSKSFIPARSVLKVEIKLKYIPRVINALARIMWIREVFENERYEVGVEFIDINKEDSNFLNYYLSRRL